MSKKTKDVRIQVILECTEHKNSGLPGTSRYVTMKSKKNTPERSESTRFLEHPNVTIVTDGLPFFVFKIISFYS
jgi:large subunit ribosomal protein L33